MNKFEIFTFGFSPLIKVSGTNRVDIALEEQRKVACNFFNSSASFVWELLPIHVHVQYLMYSQPF